jgi:tRNA 2-selenouridine synthase
MGVQKKNIEDIVDAISTPLIIDVRSPKEFDHAHIPGALSLPLFDDEQRAIVGTTYKKQSREEAIKIALPFFGDKMLNMVKQVEKWVRALEEKNPGVQPNICVHCWRGGMRSAAVAWLLDLYGFKVFQLVGGYKAYRNWIITQHGIQRPLNVVGGYTGSGKTEILHALREAGKQVIDLEGLANHKGSSFGALGQAPQPSQEMFENLLGQALYHCKDKATPVWIEDESQRIGTVMIPTVFFDFMRQCPCYFLDIPFEERLDFITTQYGSFEKEALIAATVRVQKRLGGLETKNAIALIEANDIKDAFAILLKYYDKWYAKFSQADTKPKQQILPLSAQRVDPQENAKLLLNYTSTL